MPKQLTFSEDARSAMKRGIDTMANTVGKTTLTRFFVHCLGRTEITSAWTTLFCPTADVLWDWFMLR